MSNRLNHVLLYVLGSIAFLLIPFLSTPPGTMDAWDVLSNQPQQKDLFGYVLTLGFFYACYFYFIPALYFRKRYILFILSCLLCFAFIVTVPNVLFKNSQGPQPDIERLAPPQEHGLNNTRPLPPKERVGDRPPPGPRKQEHSIFKNATMHITHNFLRFVVVLSLAMSLKIYSRWKQTQKEKAEAELAFLKAQVNPHFLFNTLNSIYSLAITGSDKTADAVVKLSSLMRYSIRDSAHDKVSIGKELDYITNYIELQRLRLSGNVVLNYKVDNNAQAKEVAPFMLISFIENAFKYGVHTEQDSVIDIEISANEERLALHVRNKKVSLGHNEYEQTGLGISNTKERLSLVYPAKHSLDIKDGNEYFEVNLSLYW